MALALKKRPTQFSGKLDGQSENLNRVIDWLDECIQNINGNVVTIAPPRTTFSSVTPAPVTPSAPFDVVYIGNYFTKIYKNAGGDLVFEDVNSGPVTLAELEALIGGLAAVLADVATLQSYFWAEAGKVGFKIQRDGKWIWFQANSTHNGLSIYKVTDV